MKRIALALFAAVGLAVSAARADHLGVYGGVSYGAPAYGAPVYGGYASGYWRDVAENVWIPPHWEVRTDWFGRSYNRWEPGHYEVRTRRIWVSAREEHERHERWEHERWEHERREHGYGRDWDDRR